MAYDEDTMPSREYVEEASERGTRRPRARDRERDGLPQRQDRLSKEQAVMDELLDLLAERLAPILAPERSSVALAGGTPSEDTGSDLARFLEHVTEREAMMAARLRTLTERIDL